MICCRTKVVLVVQLKCFYLSKPLAQARRMLLLRVEEALCLDIYLVNPERIKGYTVQGTRCKVYGKRRRAKGTRCIPGRGLIQVAPYNRNRRPTTNTLFAHYRITDSTERGDGMDGVTNAYLFKRLSEKPPNGAATYSSEWGQLQSSYSSSELFYLIRINKLTSRYDNLARFFLLIKVCKESYK